MAESNFVDYVKICCRSGKGGRGSMHLRHVKYNPNGGPDGGDGGRGGSIYLRGNHNYWTLLHLKFQRHVFAEHGGNGGRDKCHGTDGKDIYIDVPCGTVVYNAETGKYVCDVNYDGQTVLLLKGGRGGLGNFQFRTATNQAPRYAQPGEPMEEMTIILELKLLADVGLVGLPNAGKSTLLSAVSSARPKIANYPFTTLEPSLGIVDYRDHKSFVMADIPGIIEGAAEGAGLGHDFLRHVDRCRLLLHVVDISCFEGRNPIEDVRNINHELEKYSPALASRPQIIIANKCDALDESVVDTKAFEEFVDANGWEMLYVSAVTHEGIPEMIHRVSERLRLLLRTAVRTGMRRAAAVKLVERWEQARLVIVIAVVIRRGEIADPGVHKPVQHPGGRVHARIAVCPGLAGQDLRLVAAEGRGGMRNSGATNAGGTRWSSPCPAQGLQSFSAGRICIFRCPPASAKSGASLSATARTAWRSTASATRIRRTCLTPLRTFI